MRHISAGEVFTKNLLDRLNYKAWEKTGVKGQVIVLKEHKPGYHFTIKENRTEIALPKDLEVVKHTTYVNQIESTTGFQTDKYTTPEGQAAIIKEHIGRPIFTQYIKMIIRDTISTKIGISFHHYGYDLAFIP